MYNFYFSPGACSLSCHVLLEDVKAPFNVKYMNLQKGDGQKPEFLKLNPRGQVPCLQDGDFVVTENLAIIQYILAQHPGKSSLFPNDARAQTQTWQWLSYLSSTLHPAFWGTFYADSYGAAKESAQKWSSEKVAKCFAQIENQLSQNKFLVGDQCTIADVMMTVMAGWCSYLSHPCAIGPNTQRVIDTVQKLPAWVACAAREQQAKQQQAA